MPNTSRAASSTRPLSVVVAGGGTAGHIEPALAVAEALERRFRARVTALGTTRGLERDIVPARGVDLRLIDPVPVPRKPSLKLFTLPAKVGRAVTQARKVLRDVEADAVVGFGGYVAAPAYLAARREGVAIYVHEANAKAGIANKLGMRLGGTGFTAIDGCGIDGERVGIPIREELADRSARAAAARRGGELWPLDPAKATVLVTGGSQGARSINTALAGALDAILGAGVQVLHAYGKKNEAPEPREGYVPVPYIEDMQAAYGIADLVVCRCGAMTVAEVTAAGLPALYVPLPHGNGEQGLNAAPAVEAGAAELIDDAELDPTTLSEHVLQLTQDAARYGRMKKAASREADGSAALAIATRVVEDARKAGRLPEEAADEGRVDLSRVHMVGIGGAGMSGLAHILLARGSAVSGSDPATGETIDSLKEAGALVAAEHDADNLELSGAAPTVVVTSFKAIPEDNPELVEARKRGIPVIRRSELLAELMRGHRQVLIAGTHGKTSTTSMAVTAFRRAGLRPSFAIGGRLTNGGEGAGNDAGEAFVAEADESDASLLCYRPDIAVVTTVEPDHLDFFGTKEKYVEVFDRFVETITPGGHLVACLDDPGAAALAGRARARGVSVAAYGTAEAIEANPGIPAAGRIDSVEATATGGRVTVALLGPAAEGAGEEPLELALRVPGTHMALNALAALVAGRLAGGCTAPLVAGLTEYEGVRRRFDVRGTVGGGPADGATVVDDYAHHPTEVAAVLAAAREQAARRGAKVVCCFQPHLYSRTREFAEAFADALAAADELVVLDVFGAREKPVEGISGKTITDLVESRHPETPVVFEPDFDRAAETVAARVGGRDVVLTMGAGSVTRLAAPILEALEGRG